MSEEVGGAGLEPATPALDDVQARGIRVAGNQLAPSRQAAPSAYATEDHGH
jgi:hypothetical protein